MDRDRIGEFGGLVWELAAEGDGQTGELAEAEARPEPGFESSPVRVPLRNNPRLSKLSPDWTREPTRWKKELP